MRALALSAALEPLVQASRMEGNTAGPATQPGQLAISCTDHAVADQAWLHTLELLIQVGLPHADGIYHTLILVSKEDSNRQQPLTQAPIIDANLRRQQEQHPKKALRQAENIAHYRLPAKVHNTLQPNTQID